MTILYTLYGLVLGLVLFLCLGLSFYFGYKLGSKHKKEVPKINNDEQLEIERRNKGFQNVMNYDVDRAMGIKE